MSPRWGMGWLAMAFAVAFAGCDAAIARLDTDVVVRDSSGIRIVENGPLTDAPAPWRLASEPLFRVGWAEGGLIFESLSAGTIMSDSRFAVGDRAQKVYILSRAGDVLTEIGREGEGPGEFGRISGLLGLGGDTLLVVDGRNRRLSWFAGETLVREVRFAGPAAQGRVSFRTSTGGLVLRPVGFSFNRQTAPGWLLQPLLLYGPEGPTLDTIGRLGMVDFLDVENQNPFQPRGVTATGRDRIVYARTHTPEIQWIREDGTVEQIARWQPVWIHDIEEALDSITRLVVELNPSVDREYMQGMVEEMRRDAEGPLPLFQSLEADALGNVLVRKPSLNDDANDHWVLSREGRFLGSIELPANLRILEIGADVLLGVETNEWDVQAVVAYPIEKGEGS